ncbi:MAG TPA: phosphoribosyltransferase [Ideonella sp.]|nr:phosphoribosyltransferase [Ideonella sp.]
MNKLRGPFRDRAEAGRALVEPLRALGLADPVVLALPRGGVPVAAEVARALDTPLDVLLVRKIGAPWQRELAVAAVVEGERPEVVVDEETLAASGATQAYVDSETAHQWTEIARRRQTYRDGRPPLSVAGRNVILIDDGIATGTTVRAALKGLRRMQPARLVLAVPVAPPEAVAALHGEVDDLVCLSQPPFFHAVGAHYVDFRQVEDDEVVACLREHHERKAPT